MKKLMSMILAFAMVLSLLSACGSGAAPASEEAQEPVSVTSMETASADGAPAEAPEAQTEPGSVEESVQAEDPESDPVEAEEAPGELPKGFADGTLEYPICEPGEVTLSVWKSVQDKVLQSGEDVFDKNYAWSGIQEKTGVEVDWHLVSMSNYATQLSLMLATEDYPDTADVIGYNYAGGWDQAVEEGVIVDLAEYEDLIPNYMRWVNLTDGNRRNAYTDNGAMPTFAQVYNHAQNAYEGLTIRQDWLDDLGLEKPKTIGEMEEVLLAFKEEKTGGEAPLDLNQNARSPANFLEGAYNVSTESECGLILVDGQMHCSYRDQGYRDMLDQLHTWFEDGLLNPDFQSVLFLYDFQRMLSGKSGIVPAMYTLVGDAAAKNGLAPEDCYLSLLEPPTAEGYDRKVYHLGTEASGLTAGAAVVFSDSDNLEETLRWMDYVYSEEGYMLTNYGVEGETFHYDENGEPILNDLIAHNPEGLAMGEAQTKYLIMGGPTVFLLEREERTVTEEGQKYNEIWGTRGEYNLSGSLTYTPEEGEERSGVVADLTTYIQEFTAKCVMGQVELTDDAWNDFQAQLDTMGMDRVEEIAQAAYERYLER